VFAPATRDAALRVPRDSCLLHETPERLSLGVLLEEFLSELEFLRQSDFLGSFEFRFLAAH
jgi:hypothetical protein